MLNTSDLYDRPGAWLVDHPNYRLTLAAVAAIGIFMLAGAPGGLGQYHAPHGNHVVAE